MVALTLLTHEKISYGATLETISKYADSSKSINEF